MFYLDKKEQIKEPNQEICWIIEPICFCYMSLIKHQKTCGKPPNQLQLFWTQTDLYIKMPCRRFIFGIHGMYARALRWTDANANLCEPRSSQLAITFFFLAGFQTAPLTFFFLPSFRSFSQLWVDNIHHLYRQGPTWAEQERQRRALIHLLGYHAEGRKHLLELQD